MRKKDLELKALFRGYTETKGSPNYDIFSYSNKYSIGKSGNIQFYIGNKEGVGGRTVDIKQKWGEGFIAAQCQNNPDIMVCQFCLVGAETERNPWESFCKKPLKCFDISPIGYIFIVHKSDLGKRFYPTTAGFQATVHDLFLKMQERKLEEIPLSMVLSL